MLKKLKRYPYYAFYPGAIINTHSLELPLSRTYIFMVPKVFEPLKFYCTLFAKPAISLFILESTMVGCVSDTTQCMNAPSAQHRSYKPNLSVVIQICVTQNQTWNPQHSVLEDVSFIVSPLFSGDSFSVPCP